MRIARTTATARVEKLHARTNFLNGAARSGKTYAVLQKLISFATTYPNLVITICQDTRQGMTASIMRDFQNILNGTNLTPYFQEQKTQSTFTCTTTNSLIEFIGLDDPNRALGAARDILFINEAERVKETVYTQLAIRTRYRIYCDFNPTHRFWAFDHQNDPNTTWTTYTLKDNQACPPAIRQALLNLPKNTNTYRIYVQGQLGIYEGTIYTNWTQKTKPDAPTACYGLDYGDQHATAMIGLSTNPDGTPHFQQLLYQAHTTISQLADKVQRVVDDYGDAPVVCDYGGGGAALIRELSERGLQTVKADKGAGSVVMGIQLLQDTTPSYDGEDIKHELESYRWEETRTGVRTNAPHKEFDDLMDACRYAYTWSQKPPLYSIEGL